MRAYSIFSVDKVSCLMWDNILQLWKIMMIYASFFSDVCISTGDTTPVSLST